jgi:hypothetical protein
LVALLGQDKGNDQTVQTQGFCENENQNHSDEKLILLTNSSDTSVTHNTNGHTGGKTGETAAQAGGHVSVSGEGRVLGNTIRRRNNN